MKAKIRSNIKKYYLYQLFNSLEFFAPVIVLFWQSRGLNFTQIMLLQSIYAVGIIILELPTGAIADYFGKRISLVFGALFFALGLFIYGISFKFWQFVIGELTVGVGAALISGADRAFIHETLKSVGRESDYKKVEGRVRGLTDIARAVGKLLGGLIGSVSLGLTLIATGVSTFISFLVGLSFSETKVKVARKEKTEYIEIIKDSLGIVGKNKSVLWLVLFFASFNALAWSTNWFSQPYLKSLNVPVVYFGAIFASFSLISAIGSATIEQFERIVKRPFVTMSAIAIVAMFILGKFPSLYVFPLWAFFGVFIVINQTLVSDRVLSLIPSERAATILSFMNLIRRFIYAGFGPLLGLIGDKHGIPAALQFNSAVLLVVLSVLYLGRRKWFGYAKTS